MRGLAPIAAALALSQAGPVAAPPSPEVKPAADAPAAPAPPSPGARPAAARPGPPAPRPAPPAPPPDAGRDRAEVDRAARAFLEALFRSDPDALAAASAGRFSFDGQVETGRDAIRRAWRAVLARRDAPAPALAGLEVLPAPDAIARYGPPPARVAPLAARGSWVAIANVSGRAVVLFVAREGGRWAVAGMHD